ncbi:MAG: hypothetical protein C7B46_13290 [Sulfobacillus benefaciens]|uniref:DUF448 domain-containing protein n=1 Tax=Sulfobacillus benefaciens TaxID=453960 RepID=A0A2T2XE43_9FIRM|nr:MAG: hypothetical protein C7B46_13290 [Sulfobacillus benefaciens]
MDDSREANEQVGPRKRRSVVRCAICHKPVRLWSGKGPRSLDSDAVVVRWDGSPYEVAVHQDHCLTEWLDTVPNDANVSIRTHVLPNQ